jgi:hypothetical protein
VSCQPSAKLVGARTLNHLARAESKRGRRFNQTVRTNYEHRDAADTTSAASIATQMHDCIYSSRQLTVHRVPWQTGRSAKGFKARRHMFRAVGVDGAAAAFMSGVQRGKQVHHFASANLAYDETIRSHAQRLSDQVTQINAAGAFGVR